MNRPVVQRSAILDAIAPFGATLATHPVIAVGLRGAFGKDGQNTIGGFDDALVVLSADFCEAFTGNTDPSSEIPGRANLVLSSTTLPDGSIVGLHWFKPGFHHPNTPKQYAAFVQDGTIIVKRWQTESVPGATKDPSRGLCLSKGFWKGEFAIHLHDAMGVNTTGSEGCQTVIKTEWAAYHTLQMDELRKTLPPELAALPTDELCRRGIPRFPFVLIDSIRLTRPQ